MHILTSIIAMILQFAIAFQQFIFRLYSISLIAITAAAAFKGDLVAGMAWMMQPGTYEQYLTNAPMEERVWGVGSKIAVMSLFTTMGFFGSSCSAAITKNFGALTMSITSTARKATTLFLSFFLFNNVCTFEHVLGIIVFITALTTKSMRRRGKSSAAEGSASKKKRRRRRVLPQSHRNDTTSIPHATTSEGGSLLQRRTNSFDSGGGSHEGLVHVV